MEPSIGRRRSYPEAMKMRLGLVLLIVLSCTGCARLNKPAAQAATAQQAAAPQKPAPVADALPAGFTCSDGSISKSQDACLVDMARARLPPPAIERAPINPADSTGDQPTGSVR
jgi:hypothetical protein